MEPVRHVGVWAWLLDHVCAVMSCKAARAKTHDACASTQCGLTTAVQLQ